MKKILIVALCVCLLLCGCNKSESKAGIIKFDGYKGSSDAVMTINGEDVSVDEFNYFLIMASYDIKNEKGADDSDLDAFFEKTDEESGKTYGEIAIENAIKECTKFHVFRTEALDNGITLSEEDVKNITTQANGMKDKYGDRMNILQLKAGGLTPEVFMDITEMSYYSNKLFYKFVGEYKAVSDEEMQKFYEDNYVRAKHILIMTINPETGEELSEEEQKAALDEATEVFGKIQSGEDFDRLMSEHTDDTGYQLKPDGYTFARDDEYTEAFKDTAFSLAEGQVSDQIAKSEYGYHIIKREPLLGDFNTVGYEPVQEKMLRHDFQKMLDDAGDNAEIIGNKPVFESVDVAKVLGDYLAIQEETHELIKQEFMKLDEAAE